MSILTEKDSVSSNSSNVSYKTSPLNLGIMSAEGSMSSLRRLPPIKREYDSQRNNISAVERVKNMQNDLWKGDNVSGKHDESGSNNVFLKVVDITNEDKMKNRFKAKKEVPDELKSMLENKTPDERLRILFHLADRTVVSNSTHQRNESNSVPRISEGVKKARNQVLEAVIKKKLIQLRQIQVKSSSPLRSSEIASASQMAGLDAKDSVIIHRSTNSPYSGKHSEERKLLEPRQNDLLCPSFASSKHTLSDDKTENIPIKDVKMENDSIFEQARYVEGRIGTDKEDWILDDVDLDVDGRLKSYSRVIDGLEEDRLKRERREKKKKIKAKMIEEGFP